MSRRNKKYGEEWIEKKFNVFDWNWEYIVFAWTHMACGPWYSRQNTWAIEKYVVAKFKTLTEWKNWRRKRFENSLYRFLKKDPK